MRYDIPGRNSQDARVIDLRDSWPGFGFGMLPLSRNEMAGRGWEGLAKRALVHK